MVFNAAESQVQEEGGHIRTWHVHTVTGRGGDRPSVIGKRHREGTRGLLSTCKGECLVQKFGHRMCRKESVCI